MGRRIGLPLAAAGLVAATTPALGQTDHVNNERHAAKITVLPEVLNPVDDRLFGQFMEVASWGEPGPDAIADPETGDLPAEVIDLLQWMQIPVIRWPGGTDISSIDWTDRVDGVPMRGGTRVPTQVGDNTISNRVSHDAFLRLCERLNAEPLLVLHLKQLLTGQRTLEEAQQHAAAFVAYCNAPLDAALPDELLAWAALRERNGRAEPWGVPYFQIGNETFFFARQLAQAAGHETPAAQATWLADRVAAMAQAMKAVDPSIKIIFDGDLGGEPELTTRFHADPQVKAWIDLATLHSYYPMNDYQLWRGEREVDAADLTLEQLWYVWQFGPGHWEDGELYATAPGWRAAQIDGPLAHTEWNWNGWGDRLAINRHPREAAAASAVAVATHLNGMIRQGDRFVIGNQSMLVGTKWNINAVRVDPTGTHPPFLSPTGRVAGLYSRLHGNQRLAVELDSIPVTHAVSDIDVRAYGNVRAPGTPAFPLIDVVATADDQNVYLHLAHRAFATATRIAVDASRLGVEAEPAEVHRVAATLDQDHETQPDLPLNAVTYSVTEMAVNAGVVELELLPGSTVIVRLKRR